MDVVKKKSFIYILFLVYLYRITLDTIYINGIYPYYAYLYNFRYTYSLDRVIYTYLLTLVFGIIIYKYLYKNTLSSLFILTLTIIYFLPGVSIYCWDGLSFSYFIYYCISFFFLVFFDKVLPHYKISRRKFRTERYINHLAIIIAIVNAAFVVAFNGFKISIDFSDIYGLREEWSTTKLPTIMGYYQPFAARFIPILIVYFICKRNYLFVGMLVVSQLLSFTFGGMKYTFFALIIALLIGFFYNSRNRIKILYGLIVINLFSVFELLVLKRESLFVTFFTRRLSYIPNKIGYYYYEFFSNHELLYLRESFMRWFGFSNPYNKRIPALIGDYAFGKNMGANTGMFAEAYSQFGWFSSLIYPILYIFAFRLLEACFVDKNMLDYKLIFTSVILFTISFIDGAYFSILLTQGFLITCLLLYQISKVKNGSSAYRK